MASKRILAIILVVVIAVGGGTAAWFFLLAPGAGTYKWSASDAPGAPSNINASQIIKIGMVGDIGEIQGDGNYEGAYLAAKQINAAGGLEINGSTYYFGVTSEDTDESNPSLVLSRGVSAARRLIYNKKVDFAIGGFRSEALLAYQEEFMDAEIIFIDTGAATDVFTENVRDDYEDYKWFFRWMPINSTSLGGQILQSVAAFIVGMNATFPLHNITKVGILAEDLTWVTAIVGAIQLYLPYYTNLTSLGALGRPYELEVLPPILYDIALEATDMNTHLEKLESDGADIVIPAISAQGGIMMMQQYAQHEREYLIFGIDVQSQLDSFFADSGNASAYETIMQTLYETNKTSLSIDFWNAFKTEWGHEPLYIAAGAYDALYGLKDAINATQSLRALDIIAEFETWTKANPHEGATGYGAWWPNTHDLVAGYPNGYTLWCQWQPDGTKIVIPMDALYPSWLATGTYTMPPWVNATWY